MNAGNVIEIVTGVFVLSGIGWQIHRDMRADRTNQLREARRDARRDAQLEERVRRLEGRPADDDD